MKTVKVRIAVAVDVNGDWSCAGWNRMKESEAFGYATEVLLPGEARFWLTAELPVPEAQEIAATAEEAKT